MLAGYDPISVLTPIDESRATYRNKPPYRPKAGTYKYSCRGIHATYDMKKGLHLQPLFEWLLALEAWVPIRYHCALPYLWANQIWIRSERLSIRTGGKVCLLEK